MSAPATLPAPARNRNNSGFSDRAADITSSDIIVAVGDYTGGAAEDLFTLAAHGLISGDVLHVLWQSAMGAVTGGESTRAVVKYLSSSTFQLTSDGSTIIENTADGTVVFLKGSINTAVVDTVVIPRIVVGTGDATGGAAEDIFTPAQGTKGIYEADTLKLLYKSASGVVTGRAVDATVYAKDPTVTYFQLAATAGGTVIDNSADGTAVFLKTS